MSSIIEKNFNVIQIFCNPDKISQSYVIQIMRAWLYLYYMYLK